MSASTPGWLRADPTDWLLEPEDPSVRYFTLRGLLDKPAHDPEVLQARAAVMESGPVPALLARQAGGGHWGKPADFYLRSKYRGTVWTYLVLAELGADGGDPRVQAASEFILSASQDPRSGGFAYQAGLTPGGDPDSLIPCLSGNLLFALIRLGQLCDPRVQAGIEWLVRYLRFDDKEGPATEGWPYETRLRCWGRHSCHMGVVKGLKALAEIPPDQRTAEVNALIQAMSEYLLVHRVYQRSHHPGQVAMPRWLKLGFPRFYDTDILEVLLLLTRLGCR
ncbi:MAG TPA: hypothetical protein VF813_07410, partial [Anaerolineaceae bacterium]